MAGKGTTATAPTQTVETGKTDGSAAPTFDWDALTPEADAPAATYQVGVTFNPVEDTPAPIRQRVEASLATSVKAITAAKVKGNKENSVPPQWKLQLVGDEAQGIAFLKMGRKYSQYRPEKDVPFYVEGSPVGQITFRAGVVHYVPEGHADLKKEKATRPGSIPVTHTLAPEGVTPGWYVRYAAKPLESRKGK